MPYRQLHPEKIIKTLEALELRILSRFPESGLGRVCRETLNIAKEAHGRVTWMNKPSRPIRVIQGALLALLLGGLLAAITSVDAPDGKFGLFEYLQALDSVVNLFVLTGAAAIFLITLENRLKRTRAMSAVNEIRAVMHVIDMHQLTKDPDVLLGVWKDTAVSPKRIFDPFELTRYLTYCTELLALTSKVAALYAQGLPEPEVLEAVNDLERLSASFSQKIWQKITEVHNIARNGWHKK